MNQLCSVVNLTCSFEDKKIEIYNFIKYEIVQMWQMKTVKIVPIIVRFLSSISESIEKNIKKIGIEYLVELLPKHCLLGIARIIGKV